MEILTTEEAFARFRQLCNAALAMEEFPWRDLLALGYQAGFRRKVALHTHARGHFRTLEFYAETVIRALDGDGPPTIDIREDQVIIYGEVYSKLHVDPGSDWLPMLEAYAHHSS